MTPVSTSNDNPPMCFDREILIQAEQLKSLGLQWTPQIGAFVWDRHEMISAPSPFPNRVYFILSMQRFLKIFNNTETMVTHLIWVPTAFQAIEICRALGSFPRQTLDGDVESNAYSGKALLLNLYAGIRVALERTLDQDPLSNFQKLESKDDQWIQAVMQAELGRLTQLPQPIQSRIWDVYRQVGQAYLGWLRIQGGHPVTWQPVETHFEPGMLDQLNHFYSDYHKSIHEIEGIRRWVRRIRSIRPDSNPQQYQHLLVTGWSTENGHNVTGSPMDRVLDPNATSAGR